MHGYLIEPFQAGYLQRAWLELVLLSLMCGAVGTVVVLRRAAFIADAYTHTVFPGVALAFAAGWSVLLGAAVAAAVSVLALTPASRHRRLEADATLAAVMTTFFAVGVVVVSRQRSFTSDLTNLLFGRLLLVNAQQLWWTAAMVTVVLVVLSATAKELLFVAFDRAGAESLGYRVGRLDLLANALAAATIVTAAQAVGTALVIALLITPAAAARLLTDRVGLLAPISIVLAIIGGTVGLLASYGASVHHGVRLAPAATVCVVLTAIFLAIAAFARLSGVQRRDA